MPDGIQHVVFHPMYNYNPVAYSMPHRTITFWKEYNPVIRKRNINPLFHLYIWDDWILKECIKIKNKEDQEDQERKILSGLRYNWNSNLII